VAKQEAKAANHKSREDLRKRTRFDMEKYCNHILVPLDKSTLAELALADAFDIARLSQAEVTLLYVLPPIEHVPRADTDYPIYVDQQWADKKILALQYLSDVRDRLVNKDITVHTAVEMGSVAESIIDYTRRHPIDLIVVVTHGRSGWQRWFYGSVADKVLHGTDVPILLVRAHPEQELVYWLSQYEIR
jgi:nucleotide-binding universal stress UspA family protein